MRVLFLLRRVPYPLDRGDRRRMFCLAEELARHVDVRVLALGEGPDLPIPAVTMRTVGARGGTRRVVGPDWHQALLANAAEPNLRLPLQVRATLDRRFDAAVREELREWRPHVVHACPSTMAPFLWSADGRFHRHLDLIDPLSVVMEGDAVHAAEPVRTLLRTEARLLRRFEARAVARSHSSSLVAAADKTRAPGLEGVAAVPNGVDEREFPFREPTDRPATMVFVGNMEWQPNVEAVTRIVRDVLPVIRSARPQARLRIVGIRSGERLQSIASTPGVEVVGEVDHVAPELHAAACALLPMWSGAGMKNKVLEAFSAGTPVVANASGLQGIEGVEVGRHALSEEQPSSLAAACVRLLDDPAERRRLAGEAAALTRNNFSWTASAQQLLALYDRRS